MTDVDVKPEAESTEGQATEAQSPETQSPETQKKLNQSVSVTDVGPCRKHIKVTIARTDIDHLFDEKYKELVGESWVPGFRPGKAPREIVVRKYRKDVSDRVRGEVLYASLEQLAEEQDIAPLSPPNLDPAKLVIPEKGDFVYEFEVEVRPQFELPNYKGLKLKRPVKKFSEADIDQEQTKLLTDFAQLVPKEGPAEKGDIIIADMTTKSEDQVVGSVKEIKLRIDDTLTFKDGVAAKFGEQVIGARAGDVRALDIQMTEGVANANLRGKTVKAQLEVKDVKSLRMPELTHEFLHNFGVHSIEQLRERILKVLDARLEYNQRQAAREQVLQHIAEAAQWELPQDLLHRQARRAMQRRLSEMREAGLSDQEIASRQRLLERDILMSTALSLKEHFVLQKVAEVEKIDIDEGDIESEIERIADQQNLSARRVRAQLEKEDMIETLAAQLIERKALNLILESAEYEDTELGKEAGLSTADAQAVEGEMKDPTAAPPEQKKEEQPAAQ